MTTDRPYRHALPERVALQRLVAGSGSQFDPQLVDVFRGMVRMRLLPCAPVARSMAA